MYTTTYCIASTISRRFALSAVCTRFALHSKRTSTTNIPSTMPTVDKGKQDDVEYVEDSQSDHAAGEDRAAEEKALVRKIDMYLLPTIWLMYLLSVSRIAATTSARPEY